MTPLPIAVFSLLGALLIREEDESFGADISTSQLTRRSPSAPSVSNLPVERDHKANVVSLSTFLALIPFELKSNSGFRILKVNKAVGGSKSSQHMEGLAVDLQPMDPLLGGVAPGTGNRALAAWLYRYRAQLPELDQVIWYKNKSHTHVGICPGGADGCVRGAPRGEFLYTDDGVNYHSWKPAVGETLPWVGLPPVRGGEGLWARAQSWLDSWTEAPEASVAPVAVAKAMPTSGSSWNISGSVTARLKDLRGAPHGPGRVPAGRYTLEQWNGSAWVPATASALDLRPGFDYQLSMPGGQLHWGERRMAA